MVGTGGSAVWLTDAHGAPVLTLLGRPVIMTEKTPSALGQTAIRVIQRNDGRPWLSNAPAPDKVTSG